MLCCGYTLTAFPISIRLTSLALWQSNNCPSASKATLMNMDKYFMWIHYERLHNHNKAKHNKTVCIFLGMYCSFTFITTQNETTTVVSSQFRYKWNWIDGWIFMYCIVPAECDAFLWTNEMKLFGMGPMCPNKLMNWIGLNYWSQLDRLYRYVTGLME